MVAEQVYRGERKRLKTAASTARVPLSATMASWLAQLRPEDPAPDAVVFPSATGAPLVYANVYNRVLRPALVKSGIAVQTGTKMVRRRGKLAEEPVWDYQGVAFHACRHACGSLLYAHGKSLKQVQGWLRHSQLTTTMNVYIHQGDDGLGGADAWDDILGGELQTSADSASVGQSGALEDASARGNLGATQCPETAANGAEGDPAKVADLQGISEQPQTAASA
jgi:integrase-like protein